MDNLVILLWNMLRTKLETYKNRSYRKKFGNFGDRSLIKNPIVLKNTNRIFIECDVIIRDHARIEAIVSYGSQVLSPTIYIDTGVSVEQNLHLTCGEKIVIGKNVAIAGNVTITDIKHSYCDVTIPIKNQELQTFPVNIGEGTLVLNGAVICPGTSIGRNCLIFSNSVVKGEFPDYCVIAGSPARVIKQYNIEKKIWEKSE